MAASSCAVVWYSVPWSPLLNAANAGRELCFERGELRDSFLLCHDNHFQRYAKDDDYALDAANA